MSSKTKKLIYVGLAGLGVWGIANIAGVDNTVTTLHTAVSGSAWGVGAIAGTAPDVVPAAVAGWHATNSFNGSAFATPKAASPKTKTLKVPNCTKAQKKAAPAVCS